jgi:hypothetical protein
MSTLMRRTLLIATAASLLLIAAAPARAEDPPPYVNWTWLLPGLAWEYEPSSEDECRSGKPACTDRVISNMEKRFRAKGCDHDALFALAYLRTTEAFRRAVDTDGFFSDPNFMRHEASVFADAYFQAIDNWHGGRRSSVPRAWQIAFEAADQRTVSGSGDLLLGMNAHINRDLPFVHAAIGLVKPDGSSRKPDHDKVDEFLNRVQVTEELAARFDPTVKDTEVPGPFDNMTVMQLIFSWREIAWRNAERLAAAGSDAERKTVAASIEAYAASEAEAIRAATSYLPVVQSSKERDAFCAAHGWRARRSGGDRPRGRPCPRCGARRPARAGRP